MRSLRLRSPAKLNLFLKILQKREDGYHDLETVFERIDLFDDLEFSLNKEGNIRIFCDHPDVPTDSGNLVYQAARMLKDDYALENGVDITIKKRIPVAAGLAGGSSNAATALQGLSQIWKLNLNRKELLSYARKIGSDVSFFLFDTSWALGTGRGEIIKSLSLKTRLWHILIVPPLKLYSKDVFGAFQSSEGTTRSMFAKGYVKTSSLGSRPNCVDTNMLTKPYDDVNIFTRSLKKNDISTIGRLLINNLEQSIVKLCPSLTLLKEKIQSLDTQGVSFSGSGPAIFGLTETKKTAENLEKILKKDYSQVFVVQTF